MHYFPSYKLEDVLNLGFFEATRLWSIQDELKARDLRYQSFIADHPHTNAERRTQVDEWLTKRQPRLVKQFSDPELNPRDQQRLRDLMREAGVSGQ